MIQASELRVGNLLKDYKHKLQYVEVHTINRYDHTQCKATEHDSGYVYEVSLEDLRPIAITPEILEKLGFVRRGADRLYVFNPDNSSSFYYNFDDPAMCMSLHQLQNLYFAISGGKELNIEL